MNTQAIVQGHGSVGSANPLASAAMQPKRGLLPMFGEPAASEAPPVHPALAKGFRPFFLLAGAFAVTILPLWLAVLLGWVSLGGYLDPTTWHAHEVLYGFAGAVIAGFLLTAVGNWTKRETAVGFPLLALAVLWVAGRLAMSLAHRLPMGVAAMIDIAFFPALGVVIARPLVATSNRRQFVMLVVLGLLTLANVAIHLDALGVMPYVRRQSLVFGTDLVVLLCLVIAGRVFPMFTRNATGAEWITSYPKLDAAAILSMAVLALMDAFVPAHRYGAAWAGVVAILAAARAVRWGTLQSIRQPLLWILHLGYVWIVVGLGLRAIAGFTNVLSPAAALHALTVGGIGCLTLGMMARVSLGHTGRLLEAPRSVVVAFVLLAVAAFARVVLPMVAPAFYMASLVVAGSLWAMAFALFLVGYARMLVSPRVDGKAG